MKVKAEKKRKPLTEELVAQWRDNLKPEKAEPLVARGIRSETLLDFEIG